MTDYQSMMQAITHKNKIKATKVPIMAARQVLNPVINTNTAQHTPRVSGPILKQPTLNRKSLGMYHKLNYFETEVRTF